MLCKKNGGRLSAFGLRQARKHLISRSVITAKQKRRPSARSASGFWPVGFIYSRFWGQIKLQKSELQKRKNLSCTLTNENGLLRLLNQIEVAERSWATAKLPLIESKGTLKLRGGKWIWDH